MLMSIAYLEPVASTVEASEVTQMASVWSSFVDNTITNVPSRPMCSREAVLCGVLSVTFACVDPYLMYWYNYRHYVHVCISTRMQPIC